MLVIESFGLCSDNETINGTSLFLITFGSDSEPCSNRQPCSFNFETNYEQVTCGKLINDGMFGFVNEVPLMYDSWHAQAADHTVNDRNGYMYLVLLAKKDSQFFNYTVHGLCVGQRYEFSAYLASVINKEDDLKKSNIRFEVRTATVESQLLAEFSTGNISDYETMTWEKYGLSFVTPNSSVFLLMISNVDELNGNDMAIDDIELRVCSTESSGFCPSG